LKSTYVSEVHIASIIRVMNKLINVFIALMMEAVHTSETSAHSNETAQRCIPEDSKLHTRRHENLKSHIVTMLSQPHFSVSVLPLTQHFDGLRAKKITLPVM
jgi:hypothetical protein